MKNTYFYALLVIIGIIIYPKETVSAAMPDISPPPQISIFPLITPVPQISPTPSSKPSVSPSPAPSASPTPSPSVTPETTVTQAPPPPSPPPAQNNEPPAGVGGVIEQIIEDLSSDEEALPLQEETVLPSDDKEKSIVKNSVPLPDLISRTLFDAYGISSFSPEIKKYFTLTGIVFILLGVLLFIPDFLNSYFLRDIIRSLYNSYDRTYMDGSAVNKFKNI